MIRPSFLKTGDKVAIVATAKKLEQGQLDGAIRIITSWGFEVHCGPHLYASSGQFAGTDAQRAADLQWALDNPEIKAVFFARGGYGTVRIIDRLNWAAFQQHPKWLCGFSDLTVLHQHVCRQLKTETLHSTMPVFFQDGITNGGSDSLHKALAGELEEVQWQGHALNRPGSTAGTLSGGNLAVLLSISGSVSEVDTKGKILFIEDLTEYYYHLDRMMWQMKRAGKLRPLAGLVVGQFTEMMDNPVPFGKTAQEIIREAVEEYSYPVAFDAPIGHVKANHAVFHGRQASLEVAQQAVLRFK